MRYSATAFMFRQMIARAPILRTKPNSLVSDILMQMKVFKVGERSHIARSCNARTPSTLRGSSTTAS